TDPHWLNPMSFKLSFLKCSNGPLLCSLVHRRRETMKREIDKFLDTSGLMCPEPVMLLHRVMRDAEVGNVIEVIATDPSTTRDIPKFCHFLGHELLEQDVRDKQYVYYICKR